MWNLIGLIIIFPLIGVLVNTFVSWRFDKKRIGWIACGSVGLSFLTALIFAIVFYLKSGGENFIEAVWYNWITSGNLSIDFGFRIDWLSLIMALTVSFVGLLIHIYSIGYMWEDEGYRRYFIYLNLFMFMMLLLVLANNLALLFIGWEGVGLCSYLLIGYWFERDAAAEAGKKAFIVNRIGDFGFLLGLFLSYKIFGSLNYSFIEYSIGNNIEPTTILAIALLLFCGAIGKSAQFPLYVWLPDAMEGPTPVSALIHAATMVTAGVYMVCRMNFLFQKSLYALLVVSIIGLFTAFFAATMALVNKDFKRVLAYSTISQLGYMFAGAGAGAYIAAIFHLVPHAFFKAVLFMGSGAVMHALSGELNIEKMGGLKDKMKKTTMTFLAASLAISGIFPFAGFWSKDAILTGVWNKFGWAIWLIGIITASLTSFYIFRLVFEVFYSPSRIEEEKFQHVHEAPSIMIKPMIILAILSIIGGLLGLPIPKFNVIEKALSSVMPIIHLPENGSLEFFLMIASLVFSLFGIYIAYIFYIKKRELPTKLSSSLKPAYELLLHKYFVDEIYQKLVVKPLLYLSENFLFKIIDVFIIDGSVNGIGKLTEAFSKESRKIQTGNSKAYAIYIVIGIILILAFYYWKIWS